MGNVLIGRLEGAAQRLDELADLYVALHDAQITAAPQLAHMPARTAAESWTRRRAAWAQWLSAPDAFVVVAQRDGDTIGFALVTFAGGYHGWASGARVGELKDLAVAPSSRGHGVGSALLDAVEAELARLGVGEYRLNVIASNADAIRLYERRGMTQVTKVFLSKVPSSRR